MARYNMDNTPFPDAGCHVYDANGLEYFRVLEFDTESGEIVRQVTDEEGWLIEEPLGEVKRETIKAPAPLRFVKNQPGEPTDTRHQFKGRRLPQAAPP